VTAMLLQASRFRDAVHDAALVAAARELDPVNVLAATAQPTRTARLTGLQAISVRPSSVFQALPGVDCVVVLGGEALSSAAAQTSSFSLRQLLALAMVLRTSGRRFCLVGVGCPLLTSRQDAFVARQLAISSAMTVLDWPESAARLASAGVPSPIRVGADLAWLELQEPPRSESTGDDIWLTLTKNDVAIRNGADSVAEKLLPVLRAVADRFATRPVVTVQGWRTGVAAGDDLDAAADVVSALAVRGWRARVGPPPRSLAQQRDLLRGVRFGIVAESRALIAAAAAGVPVLAWSSNAWGKAMADCLKIPTLSGDPEQAVASALDSAGAALPVVRQQAAIAGEVADLLKVLLTNGVALPRLTETTPTHHGMTQGQPLGRLRPTGIMR
jgi:hypothetical protein